jgi:hypothetical protein
MYYPIHPREEPPKNGNIAVFCRTPVCFLPSAREFTWKIANVLNVIGVALDKREQTDYLILKNSANPKEKYIEMVEKVFNKIKYCFIKNKFTHLVLSGFGTNNFAYYANDFNIDARQVWKDCFYKCLDELNYCEDATIILNYIDFVPEYPIQSHSSIEKILYSTKQDVLDKTLFINAWDPHSIIGNGNELDNSLDGYWGRISAMSVLGCGLTNPNIRTYAV